VRIVFYSSLPSILPRLLMITSVGNTRQIDLLHHGLRAVAVWRRRRLRLVHSVLCTLSPLPLATACATLPGVRSGGCVPCAICMATSWSELGITICVATSRNQLVLTICVVTHFSQLGKTICVRLSMVTFQNQICLTIRTATSRNQLGIIVRCPRSRNKITSHLLPKIPPGLHRIVRAAAAVEAPTRNENWHYVYQLQCALSSCQAAAECHIFMAFSLCCGVGLQKKKKEKREYDNLSF